MGLLSPASLTYGNIKINAPFEIVKLLHFRMEQRINSHGKVYLTAIIPDEAQDKYNGLVYDNDLIEVYEITEHQALFKGIVTSIKIQCKNSVYYMKVEASSLTCLMDQKLKSRSFSNKNLTYYNLFREVIDAYSSGDFINLIDADKTLGEFTLQYQESDWEFLVRMASRFQSGLIAEVHSGYPRLWLGTSKDQVMGELNSINYSIQKSSAAPKHTYIEVEDTQRFSLGDIVVFQDNHWSIEQITARIKEGILKFDYILVAETGIPRPTIYNNHLSGVSIEGKIIDVQGESVRLHLKIDQIRPSENNCWFPYPTLYTGHEIGWHCMPELSDTVHLYFPSFEEQEAYVIQSLRKGDHKGDEISKPDRKLFHTKSGKIARFNDHEAAISTQEDKLIIRLNPSTGIHVYSHHDMTIHAEEDLVLHGNKVQLSAASELNLASKTSYIRANGSLHIKSSNLMSDQVPDAELKAYDSLVKELNGKNYPQWAQNLLLEYKTQYYKAKAAGDTQGCKEAAAKSKQLRGQLAEIDAMPSWARAQMHEYTAAWWEAHAANNKAQQDKIHGLANKLRNNLKINELIREYSSTSYQDANRLEELSQQYADAVHKLTVADLSSMVEEAAAIRSKYGVNNQLARENLNKLAKKYPDSFSYKLLASGDWDAALNKALYDFSSKYGLTNKGYSRDVLEVYLHQVANGVLPWPKNSEKPTAVPPKQDTSPSKSNSPVQEQPAPAPSSSSATEKRNAIVELAKKFEGRIPYCMDTRVTTMKLDVNNPPKYMDCSDFTSSVYLTVLDINIGQTTKVQIYRGEGIEYNSLRSGGDYSTLKPGDLILFNWGADNKNDDGLPDHVGIYIGNGEVIHESGNNQNPDNINKKDMKHNVRVNPLSATWVNGKPMYHFVSAVRRIIQDDGSIKNK
ncbi:NlpC/P60 family protein [Paenibacillus durus]|uniref:NlpC/P60 domain-containing protein n=1 Tax=Paenibacillus durus ATCC 35681 TaxID=1333534 RepID=A0A0F7CIF8_PAEDU|nr:NlpC/P60 family protein [Paenibacillus durus]AKG35291.1 hypothetical protein VK70_12490 [Paenibacillus durus ATCC 35681]